MNLSQVILKVTIGILILIKSMGAVSAQEVNQKMMKTVKRMANSELRRLYNDPSIMSRLSDIKFTMKPTELTEAKWSDHESVELNQVSFDVEVMYNKIINEEDGEIGTYKETLKCVLGKYKSFRWNRMSLYRGECQDCEETLVELKRVINPRYAS